MRRLLWLVIDRKRKCCYSFVCVLRTYCTYERQRLSNVDASSSSRMRLTLASLLYWLLSCLYAFVVRYTRLYTKPATLSFIVHSIFIMLFIIIYITPTLCSNGYCQKKSFTLFLSSSRPCLPALMWTEENNHAKFLLLIRSFGRKKRKWDNC